MVNLFGASIEPSLIIITVIVVVFIVIMIVVPMFTNKKRQQQVNTLYNDLAVGDKIKTVGGVIGTVLEIRTISPVEKEILLSTGEPGKETTMWFDIQALYQNLSKLAAPKAETVEATTLESEPVEEIETSDAPEAQTDSTKSESLDPAAHKKQTKKTQPKDAAAENSESDAK